MYRDFCASPHNWTVLHLLALFEEQSIHTMPTYEELQVPFLIDKYGKTPFHYLISQDRVDYHLINIMFEYILDYLEDTDKRTPAEYQIIFDSLSPVFLFIVSKINPTLVNRFMKISFMPSTSIYGQTLPRFGKSSNKYLFARAPLIDPDIQAKIYDDGQDRVVFRTLMLNLDYSILSDDMFKCVAMFIHIKNEEFFRTKAITNLINHLWRRSKPFIKFMALLYSCLIVLVSVYIGYGIGIVPLECTILGLTSVFIISEFIQMKTLKLEYFSSFWNWTDLAYFVLLFTAIICRFANFEYPLVMNWMYSGIIMTGYLRWISYLRLFLTTSKKIIIIRINNFNRKSY